MKTAKFYLASISLLLFSFLSAQDFLKIDWQSMNLKGTVKSIHEISYEAIGKSGDIQKGEMKSEFYENDKYFLFDQNGWETEDSYYFNWKKSRGHYHVHYSYDDQGNILEKSHIDSIGKVFLEYKLTYKYDSSKRIREETKYDWLDSVDCKYKYSYDSIGEKEEGDLFIRNEGLFSKSIFKYDEKGRVIEKCYSSGKGIQTERWACKYDEAGNIIEDAWYSSKNKIFMKYNYKRDDKANITEMDWYKSNGKLREKRNYEFDYDKNGNWIKRIEFINDKPKYIVERELQYY